jgi:hypothetical protein
LTGRALGGDEMSGEVRTVLESGGRRGDERGGETHERLGDATAGRVAQAAR